MAVDGLDGGRVRDAEILGSNTDDRSIQLVELDIGTMEVASSHLPKIPCIGEPGEGWAGEEYLAVGDGEAGPRSG